MKTIRGHEIRPEVQAKFVAEFRAEQKRRSESSLRQLAKTIDDLPYGDEYRDACEEHYIELVANFRRRYGHDPR